jgi:hypothetical protein
MTMMAQIDSTTWLPMATPRSPAPTDVRRTTFLGVAVVALMRV